MPRYHFHVHDGTGVAEDEEGRELADLDAARVEALKGARSLIAEEALAGRIDMGSRIEVTDGTAEVVLTVRFADAVTILH